MKNNKHPIIYEHIGILILIIFYIIICISIIKNNPKIKNDFINGNSITVEGYNTTVIGCKDITVGKNGSNQFIYCFPK